MWHKSYRPSERHTSKYESTNVSLIEILLKFLVHLITPEGIRPNKRNIEAVTYFLTPVKIKDVRAFLGLYNYYQRFIKNYSVLAGPLLQLLKKNAAFHCIPCNTNHFWL